MYHLQIDIYNPLSLPLEFFLPGPKTAGRGAEKGD